MTPSWHLGAASTGRFAPGFTARNLPRGPNDLESWRATRRASIGVSASLHPRNSAVLGLTARVVASRAYRPRGRAFSRYDRFHKPPRNAVFRAPGRERHLPVHARVTARAFRHRRSVRGRARAHRETRHHRAHTSHRLLHFGGILVECLSDRDRRRRKAQAFPTRWGRPVTRQER